MTPYHRAALAYLEAGWTDVLPLPMGQKSPPPGGFTGNAAPHPSRADIQAWLDDPASGNVAIRMPSGVIGLDVDHGYPDPRGRVKNGDGQLAELKHQLGPLPLTWVSGARAYPSGIRWFRVPPGLTWPSKAAQDIEILCRAYRYAVVPPSVHPGGNGYRWFSEESMLSSDWLPPHIDDLVHLPTAWVEHLSTTHERALPDAGQQASWWARNSRGDEDPCQQVADALASHSERLAAGEGRHGVALSATARLAHLHAEGHVGAVSAWKRFGQEWFAAVVPERGEPAARREWDRLLAGAVALAQADHPSAPEGDPCEWHAALLAAARQPVSTPPAPTTPTAPPTPPPPPWVDEQTWAAQLEQVAPVAQPAQPEQLVQPALPPAADAAYEQLLATELLRERARREARRLVDRMELAAIDSTSLMSEILTSAQLDEVAELAPLVDGWLWQDTVARMVGRSRSFKSFVAVDIACRVASGLEWFGHPVNARPVLYLAAEGGGGIRKRVRAWEGHHGLPPLEHLHVLPRAVQVLDAEWAALVRACADLSAGLVVLDTQARITVGAEENSATDMGQLVEQAERLREATGACVLLIHHTGHEGGRARGSTAVYAALQTELMVERDGDADYVSVKATKQKDDEELGPYRFHLVESGESLVLVNISGDDADMLASPLLRVGEAVSDLELSAGQKMDKVALVLNSLSRADGVTKAELRRAVDEQFRVAGIQQMSTATFYRVCDDMQVAGWVQAGATPTRLRLSAAGRVALGLEGVSP